MRNLSVTKRRIDHGRPVDQPFPVRHVDTERGVDPPRWGHDGSSSARCAGNWESSRRMYGGAFDTIEDGGVGGAQRSTPRHVSREIRFGLAHRARRKHRA